MARGKNGLFTPYNNFLYHYWIKTCENAMKHLWIKLWKNMWTVQFHMFSHMVFTPFSQGVKPLRPCEQGIFHRVRTYAKPCEKPCEFLTCENTCERPSVKNLWTFTVFFTGWKISKPVNRPFFMVRTCGKNSEMGGVYLAAVCCQPPRPRPTEKKYNVEVWFLFPSQI